jgi:hypothetical protein
MRERSLSKIRIAEVSKFAKFIWIVGRSSFSSCNGRLSSSIYESSPNDIPSIDKVGLITFGSGKTSVSSLYLFFFLFFLFFFFFCLIYTS